MTIATDIGRRPISDGLPAGADARDTTEFDQVQIEIGKLSSLSGDCVVNWAQVVPLCETIITSQGKDLLIACYLAGSLLETEGPVGLANGLDILADMLQTYWDSLFPSIKRMRARRNALQWLIDRISQKAAETSWQETPVDGEVLDSILGRLRAIDVTLTEKDDEAPSMRPLLSLLGALPRMEKEISAPSTTTLGAVTVPAAGDAADAAVVVVVPSLERSPAQPSPTAIPRPLPAAASLDKDLAAEKALALLAERVSELAEWYQGIDLENPASYRLKRIALWSAIEASPPDQSGKTFVSGPQPQTVETMRRLEAGGSVEEIIHFCENQLAIQPFWLDVNRLVAKALALGGVRFTRALESVESETARFISRLPKLSGLTFSNGQPFADAATLSWLSSLASAAARLESHAAAGDVAPQALIEFRNLAAAGKMCEAAARIQQEIVLADSAKMRFTLRLQLCEMLVAQGVQAKFTPFARILLADIDRFSLDKWEPKLALQGLQLAYRLLLADPECRNETDAIMARITRLDPATALGFLMPTNGS